MRKELTKRVDSATPFCAKRVSETKRNTEMLISRTDVFDACRSANQSKPRIVLRIASLPVRSHLFQSSIVVRHASQNFLKIIRDNLATAGKSSPCLYQDSN